MRRLRAWLVRAAGLFTGGRRDRDFAEELESHLRLHIDDNIARGMTPTDARREALRHLGGIDQTTEHYHVRGTLPFIEHVVIDLRLAARTLAKRPLLTASAVLSIGIGVGLNVSLYAVARRALFESFITTPTPDRLAWVSEGVSFPDYEDIRQRLHGIDLAAMQMTGLTWNHDGDTISASTHVVSRNFFDTLGVPAFAGRTFGAADRNAAHDPYEVVLSFGFWQRRLAGDPSAVGRTLLLNDRAYTILGILPRGFSSMFVMTPDLYVPIDEHVTTALLDRNPAQFDLLARIPAGATREQSTGAVRSAAEQVETSVARTHTGWARAIVLRPTRLVGTLLPNTAIMGVTVFAFLLTGLVLLVACANVAGLLLARADARRREVAMRIALGATRARIVQQFLAESLLIGVGGCGVGAAAWKLCVALAPQFAVFFNVSAQITVLSGSTPFVFCAALALGVMIACGIIPAVGASHAAPVGALRREAAIPNLRPIVLQRALIATQVAVSFVLLTAAFALLQTFIHLQTTDPGFDAAHTVHIDTSGSANTRVPTFFELKDTVAALPGVQSVSGTRLPLAFIPIRQPLRRVGGTDGPGVSAAVEPVKSRYFETLRIPLERGRDLRDDDLRGAPGTDVAAVANDTFAHQYLTGDDVDTARFVVPADYENGIPEKTLRIVGVARDSLGKAGVATLYMADARPRDLIVRVAGSAEGAVNMLRSAVAKREAGATVTAAPMSDQIAFAMLPSRVGTWVLCAMGGLALLLAMVGLHGAVSYAASRRTFEIGVRTALGASRGSIVRMVLKDGATAVGAGCAIGVVLAIPLVFALRPILAAQQRAFDPLAMLAVFAILLVVGAAATLRPARRASRVDPLIALRSE